MIGVGELISFSDPENEERAECNREEHWKSNTVEHGDVQHSENLRELVMNDMIRSCIKIKILVNLSGLCEVLSLFFFHTASPAVVSSLSKPNLEICNSFEDRRHKGIEVHGTHKNGTNASIPIYRVIVKVTTEHLSKIFTEV